MGLFEHDGNLDLPETEPVFAARKPYQRYHITIKTIVAMISVTVRAVPACPLFRHPAVPFLRRQPFFTSKIF
jgi:hypothetical protein